MGTKQRKSYSKEFKTNAVRMLTEEGKNGAELARELGIQVNMLYAWKRKYLDDKGEAFPGHGKLKSGDEYIRKLELENKRLRDERDILKKAAIFFAKEP